MCRYVALLRDVTAGGLRTRFACGSDGWREPEAVDTPAYRHGPRYRAVLINGSFGVADLSGACQAAGFGRDMTGGQGTSLRFNLAIGSLPVLGDFSCSACSAPSHRLQEFRADRRVPVQVFKAMTYVLTVICSPLHGKSNDARRRVTYVRSADGGCADMGRPRAVMARAHAPYRLPAARRSAAKAADLCGCNIENAT